MRTFHIHANGVGPFGKNEVVSEEQLNPRAIERLLASGHIQEVTIEEVPAPVEFEQEEEEDANPEHADMASLSMDDLRAIAGGYNLEDLPKSKTGLITAIKKARADATAGK